MSILEHLKRDLELTPGLACPNCQGTKIRGRSTRRSFRSAGVVTIVLFGVYALVRPFGPPFGPFNLWLFLLGLALMSLAATVAAGLSLLIGWNQCADCRHRWR